MVTGANGAKGCLLVQGALAGGAAAQAIQREMAKRRTAGERALRVRFERAIRAGDLPPQSDAAQLARYASAVSYGVAVQGAAGASAAELGAVAEQALAA